jgi:hypothetical protein
VASALVVVAVGLVTIAWWVAALRHSRSIDGESSDGVGPGADPLNDWLRTGRAMDQWCGTPGSGGQW